jgi:hypothetical protein
MVFTYPLYAQLLISSCLSWSPIFHGNHVSNIFHRAQESFRNFINAEFHVLSTVDMKIPNFSDISPFSPLNVYRFSELTCHLHLHIRRTNRASNLGEDWWQAECGLKLELNLNFRPPTAVLWSPWPKFTFSLVWNLLVRHVGRPLWREDRSVFCSSHHSLARVVKDP